LQSVKRKSGFQEVPKILIEQSNKHLRNRNALSKFMTPIANKSLRNIITPGMKKKFREDKKLSKEIKHTDDS
jgi:hypothetical protein